MTITRLTAVLLFAALCLQPLAGSAQTTDLRQRMGTSSLEAARRLERGIQLAQTQRNKAALREVRAALAADAKCQLAHYWHSLIQQRLGDLDGAVATLEKLIALAARRRTNIGPEALYSAGLIQAKLGRHERALRYWSRAVLYDPHDEFKTLWRSYRNIAIAHLNRGQLAAAYLAACEGARLNPKRVTQEFLQGLEKKLEAFDGDAAQLLLVGAAVSPPPIRTARTRFEEVALQGQVPFRVTQLLCDPLNDNMILLGQNERTLLVVRFGQSAPRVERIELRQPIRCGSLRKGQLHLVLSGPARLVRMDTVTGKTRQLAALSFAPSSIAVFTEQQVAFFPDASKELQRLDLRTGRSARLEQLGERVRAHPTEPRFFAFYQSRAQYANQRVIVQGRQYLLRRKVSDEVMAGLMRFEVARGAAVFSGLRQRAGWNARQIALSPRGGWVALVAGGGFRPSGGGGGYGIGVFPSNSLEAAPRYFPIGAYPQAAAINAVTGQVGVVSGRRLRVFALGDDRKRVLFERPAGRSAGGGYGHVAAWSADGRYLLVASKQRGLICLRQDLTREEVGRASALRTPGAEPPRPAEEGKSRESRAPRAWLATYRPENTKRSVLALLRRALRQANETRLPSWKSRARHRRVADPLGVVLSQTGPRDHGVRIYRLRKLLERYPDALPARLQLGLSLSGARQTEAAEAELLAVVRGDQGRTDLSIEALQALAVLQERQRNRPFGAMHCLCAALVLDRALPSSLQRLRGLFVGQGMRAEADRLREQQARSVPRVSKGLPALGRAPDTRQTFTASQVFRKAARSTVLIRCGNATGTGFCVGKRGLILTNDHVVSGGGAIWVTPYDLEYGRPRRLGRLSATLRFRSSRLDIAVLELRDPPKGLLPLVVANRSPEVGDTVFAIGHPGMGGRVLDQTISQGIVSAAQRQVAGRPYLQHTAAVNPGNSGGPLLDDRCRVVGLVTLKASLENVGFAVPPEVIREVFGKR